MVEPKAFQDALLAYHARPADREAEAVRASVLDTLPRCKCGQPWVLNTVHRANSPCWLAQEPPGGLGPNSDGVMATGEAQRQRPVCTYASGCDCNVPRPLPQGNKAWHCPKQQEHAAKVWNSMCADEGRSKP